MTDYSDHIGIIGGGIAGLTLGCSLLKDGIPATIFEKMPEEISHGAALSLSSNALRLLHRLDIYNDLKNQSFIHSAASIQGPQNEISSFQTPEVLTTRRQILMTLLYSKYINLGGEVHHDHAFDDFDAAFAGVPLETEDSIAINFSLAKLHFGTSGNKLINASILNFLNPL